jgi:hypothetical protein
MKRRTADRHYSSGHVSGRLVTALFCAVPDWQCLNQGPDHCPTTENWVTARSRWWAWMMSLTGPSGLASRTIVSCSCGRGNWGREGLTAVSKEATAVGGRNWYRRNRKSQAVAKHHSIHTKRYQQNKIGSRVPKWAGQSEKQNVRTSRGESRFLSLSDVSFYWFVLRESGWVLYVDPRVSSTGSLT